MQIKNDLKLDFSDVLILPKRSTLSSRKDVNLTRKFKFLHSGQTWEGVPVVASNMDGVATFELAEKIAESGLFTCLHKFHPLEKLKEESTKKYFQNCSITSGIKDEDLEHLDKVVQLTNPKFITLDVANGYTERFVRIVEKIRKKYPKITLIAGNVITREMVEQLILSGADIVKVGIGPGSVCTTRKKTGVGYPQLSGIIECADAAHGIGGMLMADGGCTVPGDVAKAFGAGADFVMLGGMFAGHDEGGGEIIEEDGEKYIIFYGSSSEKAMNKHFGKVNDYRTTEGKVVKVKYRGKVENTVTDILGGLRSTCTYVGARKLKNLTKCTTFIRVNNQLNNVFGMS